MNYFLEPHEKIKEIRKKYKITQGELAGEVYTQGYITALERGVKKPTDKNIIDLVGRFNEILSEKGIDHKIRIEDIKKDREQAEKEFINKILGEVEGLTDKKEIVKKFRAAKLKITQASIENQIRVYERFCELTKKYELWDDMKEASAFLVMKREKDKDLTKFGEAFLELTRACAMTEDADYINPFEENYVEKIKNIDTIDKEKAYYNLNLIFCKSIYKEKSLYYLNELEKMNVVFKTEMDLLISKAFVLEHLNEYEKAKKIYQYIIRKNNRDRNYLIWAKQNITSILMKENNIDEIKKNYSFLKKELKQEGVNFIGARYGSLGEIAEYLSKKNDAKKFYEVALDYALENYEKYREAHYIDCFEILFKLYKKRDKDKVVKYEELFRKLNKKKFIKKASFSFMKYYLENKLYEELSQFIETYEKISEKV